MNYSGIPLTNILFGNEHSKIKFVCLGNESYKTQIYKFFDNLSDKNIDSIIGVLGYINNTFPVCSHPIKFKKFSGQEFYEIKAYQIRIACFWEKNVLIAFMES